MPLKAQNGVLFANSGQLVDTSAKCCCGGDVTNCISCDNGDAWSQYTVDVSKGSLVSPPGIMACDTCINSLTGTYLLDLTSGTGDTDCRWEYFSGPAFGSFCTSGAGCQMRFGIFMRPRIIAGGSLEAAYSATETWYLTLTLDTTFATVFESFVWRYVHVKAATLDCSETSMVFTRLAYNNGNGHYQFPDGEFPDELTVVKV